MMAATKPINPFSVDLIRKLIFSHLGVWDLRWARLVAREWVPLATEEYRGRKTTFPSIGSKRVDRARREDERSERRIDSIVLDEGSAARFIEVMSPCLPHIPFQQVCLRLDLLALEPSTLLTLLTFIAPWVKSLRLVPWLSRDIDLSSPLVGEEGRKADAWTSSLSDFSSLRFPSLETLEVGENDKFPSLHRLHPTLADIMMNLLKNIVQEARGLKTFLFSSPFFGCEDEEARTVADREATKVLAQVLPHSSLSCLGFGDHCAVDYEALTILPKLNLESFMGKGKPDSIQAFLAFMDGQKSSLKHLQLPDLEEVYVADFPKLLLIHKFMMAVKPNSTLECLNAFPALVTVRLELSRGRPESNRSIDFSHIPTHPSVQKLVIRGFSGDYNIPFSHLAWVFPNLRDLDFDCLDESHLTPLFTHMTTLQSLKLNLNILNSFQELQALLIGIHPSVTCLARDFDIWDAEAFHAIEVIGSRRTDSTVGLANLKNLRVLDVSEFFEFDAVFLSKLTFGIVFNKMMFLREIRLSGKPKKVYEPVLEALSKKGITVRECVSWLG